MIIEWSNEPDLEWQNTTVDYQWLNELDIIIFYAATLFIAESRGYYFKALEKANYFLSDDKSFYLESNTKP